MVQDVGPWGRGRGRGGQGKAARASGAGLALRIGAWGGRSEGQGSRPGLGTDHCHGTWPGLRPDAVGAMRRTGKAGAGPP